MARVTKQRRGRVLIASLAGLLTVLGLSVVPTDAAPVLGDLQEGVQVTDVTSEVRPNTPLWSVEVTFTVEADEVQCPADLHFRFHTKAHFTPICGAGETAPATVTKTLSLINDDVGSPQSVQPSGSIEVAGEVRDPGDKPNSSPCFDPSKTPSNYCGPAHVITTPPKPVWVGIGDGYTSQLIQANDGDTTPAEYDTEGNFATDPFGDVLKNSYRPNDRDVSWVRRAVTGLNGQFNVPTQWRISDYVIATDGATALGSREDSTYAPDAPAVDTSDLAAQVDDAIAALGAAQGSWNWVGMSVGLVDAGIPQALDTWYQDPANDYADETAPLPWEARTSLECPDLSGSLDTITGWGAAGSNTVRTALQSQVQRLIDADPSGNLRIIQVLYPYLTETTQTVVDESGAPAPQSAYGGSYTNPCAGSHDGLPGFHEVMDNLNAALDIGSNSASDRIFSVPLSAAADMGTYPTGRLVYYPESEPGAGDSGTFRDGSYLQLSRPYGYPYPTDSGAGRIGDAVIDVVFSQASDDTPPVVDADYRNPDWGIWHNKPVTITWTATDEGPGASGIKSPVPPTWTWAVPESPTGQAFVWTSDPAEDNAGNVAVGNAQLATDYTAPVVSVGTDRLPNANGWFKDPVTVTWSFAGPDAVSGIDTTTCTRPSSTDPALACTYRVVVGDDNAEQGSITVTNPVPSDDGHRYYQRPAEPATMCDRAGNCGWATSALKVDTGAPVGSVVVPPAIFDGWHRPGIDIRWVLSDAVSGLDEALLDPAVNPTTLVENITETGVFTRTRTFWDKAGNQVVISADLKVDGTAPQIDASLPSAHYTTEDDPAGYPIPTCIAQDAQSGGQSCVVNPTPVITPHGNGTWTYAFTATATDNVGNQTTGVLSYLLIDGVPPTLVVDYVKTDVVAPTLTAPNGKGWFKAPVDLYWQAADQALTDGLRFPFNTADGTVRETKADNMAEEFSKTVMDAFGNVSAPAKILVNVDLIDPNAKPLVNGSETVNAWYNGDVVITWAFDGADPGPFASGNDPDTTPTGTQLLAATGTASVPVGTMCDNAGRCATRSVQVNIDKDDPIVTPSLSGPTKNDSGWFTGPVTVSWGAEDVPGGSGLAGNQTFSDEDVTQDGETEVTSSGALDVAGNTGTGRVTVKIDSQDPTVNWTGLVDGVDEYSLADMPTPGCVVEEDDGSPAAGCQVDVTQTSIENGLFWLFQLAATGYDEAGNSTTVLTSYRVGPRTPNVMGVVVQEPTGKPVDPNDLGGDRWFNVAPDIDWSVIPQEGFQALADTVADIDGKRVVYTSAPVRFTDGSLVDPPAVPATVTVSLDTKNPVAKLTNVVPGKSGVDTCELEELSRIESTLDASITLVTVRAKATDRAGNVGYSAPYTYRYVDQEQATSGRMTGSAEVGVTAASFTLRCNGSPNQLEVKWAKHSSFKLTHVDGLVCWDDERWNEAQPDAPMDALWLVGKGKLANGSMATIEILLTDRGEPAKGKDTLGVIIRDANGNVVHSVSSAVTGGGNVQAHYAQGNGTNNNGHVNGPNGHNHDYDDDGFDRAGYDHDGYDRGGWDRDGYDRNGCDRNGRDRQGYDKSGYDRKGYDRHGYNKQGYDDDGDERSKSSSWSGRNGEDDRDDDDRDDRRSSSSRSGSSGRSSDSDRDDDDRSSNKSSRSSSSRRGR
jgi:hypothetical protein